MMLTSWPLLSILWTLPLGGSLLVSMIPGRFFLRPSSKIYSIPFIIALIALGISIALAVGFDPRQSALQYTEHASWLPAWHVHYTLGVDGVSLGFLLLATLIFSLAFLVFPRLTDQHLKTASILLLLTESACLASFLFQNVFLFYIAFESVLIPMALLIGLLGGKHRVRAALTFFLYTFVGSLLLLVALILCVHYSQTGHMSQLSITMMPPHLHKAVWLMFFLALAIKVPLFPFHTWLPLAHVEAPTLGSVILAALLLKMGGYGLVRFPFCFFEGLVSFYQPIVWTLSVISILYGSWVAWAQTDLKKLIAYSSVAHMGYVTLGLATHTPVGMQGAMMQMISHGFTSGGLFLCVGMLYKRFHHRDLLFYGGLKERMPLWSGLFMTLTLAAMALPGTSGFIGEFCVLLGSTHTWGFGKTFLAALGMIGSAAYGLKYLHLMLFGPLSPGLSKAPAAAFHFSVTEHVALWILVGATLLLGLYPEILLRLTRVTLEGLL